VAALDSAGAADTLADTVIRHTSPVWVPGGIGEETARRRVTVDWALIG
jgi:hypothetical protein